MTVCRPLIMGAGELVCHVDETGFVADSNGGWELQGVVSAVLTAVCLRFVFLKTFRKGSQDW